MGAVRLVWTGGLAERNVALAVVVDILMRILAGMVKRCNSRGVYFLCGVSVFADGTSDFIVLLCSEGFTGKRV